MNENKKTAVNLPPTPSETVGPRAKQDRRAELYALHPDECPEVIGVLPYLIHPPSRLSSTASWIYFRDKTVLPALQQRPEDPNLPNFLKQIEAILTWRVSVPAEDRFWKPD